MNKHYGLLFVDIDNFDLRLRVKRLCDNKDLGLLNDNIDDVTKVLDNVSCKFCKNKLLGGW